METAQETVELVAEHISYNYTYHTAVIEKNYVIWTRVESRKRLVYLLEQELLLFITWNKKSTF